MAKSIESGAMLPPDLQGLSDLRISLDNELPQKLAIGKGTALHLNGWCFHPTQKIRHLNLLVNNVLQPVTTQRTMRTELRECLTLAEDPHRHAVYGGFMTMISMPEGADRVEISLQARLCDGRSVQASLGAWQIPRDLTARPDRQAAAPLVAICMATYNPDLVRFRRQIESIRAQSYPNWICIISDDASTPELLAGMQQILSGDSRFLFFASTTRLGFYHNFERALTLSPLEAEFIAFSDQDDYWQPHKLAKCISCFTPETWLVYSNMRIVRETGEIVATTYWKNRKNNFTNLGSLLLINCVPGAGTVFRRRLLEYALPFPSGTGKFFQDHWIAVTALALGKLAFVDEPLYDWLQHSSNVIGFVEQPRQPLLKMIGLMCKQLTHETGRVEAKQVYYNDVVRLALIARVVWLRCRQQTTWRKRQVLKWAGRLDHSWWSTVWLALRGMRDWQSVGITNGVEYYLLQGMLWRHYLVWMSRWQQAADNFNWRWIKLLRYLTKNS